MKYVTKGTLAGAFSLLAVVAGVFGKPALATFLNDPATPLTVLTVAGGLGSLVAGFLKGVEAA